MRSYKSKNKDKHKVNNKILPLTARTDNQKDYIGTILENDVTFCSGPAGSGKSYIAAGIAAHCLHRKEIDTIIITRPLVCTGKDLGSLPGEMMDKIAPYLLPMKDNVKLFLGAAHYGHYSNAGQIQYKPLETMRGATFNKALMILDEAQNCTEEQIKMFVTRMGSDTKVIINGDANQTDLRGKSGLVSCMEKCQEVDGIGMCTLGYEDIQRNGIIGRFLQAMEK